MLQTADSEDPEVADRTEKQPRSELSKSKGKERETSKKFLKTPRTVSLLTAKSARYYRVSNSSQRPLQTNVKPNQLLLDLFARWTRLQNTYEGQNKEPHPSPIKLNATGSALYCPLGLTRKDYLSRSWKNL